ncbi:MAG: sigma factor-like helix-turn-helix DNA-binding protein [Ilumatobacteraceae bacterium]
MQPRLPHTVNRPLLARLDREWQAIAHRPAVLRRAHGWALGVPFACLDELVAATGATSVRTAGRLAAVDTPAAAHGPTPSDDQLLGRLVMVARRDDVAARVVLQRLLPGIVSRARRWSARRDGGSADAFDELLSAVWTVIREFPVERYSQHVAARMLREAEYRAFGRARRRLLVHELVEPRVLDVPVEPSADEPLLELLEVIAQAGALPEADRRLLVLLAGGSTQAELAQLLEVSERTVRYHRDAMVHRLRSLVAA